MPYKDKERQKQAQHESYLRNKEKVRARNRLNRRKKFKLLIEFKEERGCKICGEKRGCCLVFHHRSPKEKKDNIGTLITKNYGINSLLKEIEKCDVLCSNCHRELHWSERRDDIEQGILEDKKLLGLI